MLFSRWKQKRNVDGDLLPNLQWYGVAVARKWWCFKKSKAGQPLTCGQPPDLNTIHLSVSLLALAISFGRWSVGWRSSRSLIKSSVVVRSSWYLTTKLHNHTASHNGCAVHEEQEEDKLNNVYIMMCSRRSIPSIHDHVYLCPYSAPTGHTEQRRRAKLLAEMMKTSFLR